MNRFFAWLFDREDSGAARAGKFSFVLLLCGLAVGILLVATGRSNPDFVERPRARMRPRSDEDSSQQSQASVERTIPIASTSDAQVAAAMDETAVRHHLGRLRMAASTGDEAGRDSALRSLTRYGRAIKPLLTEEIAKEPDPVVRAYLDDARKSLK